MILPQKHTKTQNTLNAPTKTERLAALKELYTAHKSGELECPVTGTNVNCHIHTTYSFSPYSPARAAYTAWLSGLSMAGIMDHDSVGGAEEFLEAGEIIGLPVTVGFELRVSLAGTEFQGRRVNNTDQDSVAYLAMHAIPHHNFGLAEEFLRPIREKRNERNKKMVERLNTHLASCFSPLNFLEDVLPLSQYENGGTVTERHILYALASKITDAEPHRHFLLGLFKAQLMANFYINADEELPHITEFIALAEKLGAIPAYAYLGDVGISVTGDKKTQTFEDSYIDELVAYLKQTGFKAITYMPSRNTLEQLRRVKSLCEANGLMQISGEDINSPTQSFICDKIETPEFQHLKDTAWALIEHERKYTIKGNSA